MYCECEFHDTVEGAKWIVEHTTEIGEAIAKGLCKYLGVAFVPAQTQKPAEEPKADAEQVLYPGPGGSLRRPRQRRQDAGKAESGGVCRVRGEREEVRL